LFTGFQLLFSYIIFIKSSGYCFIVSVLPLLAIVKNVLVKGYLPFSSAIYPL
jgi:hypothetical protein